MDSQRFHVKILFKLEAVTCPGVWLCSHGYLEVTINTLGYFFRTRTMEPFFPLLCRDQFKIEGHFKNAPSIKEVIKNLYKEPLEITLWQNGRRLSYYQGVIMDLLQYIEPQLKCPHTNTSQLLMKTTQAFPGIIAPKIEIASEFYIKDKILNINNTSQHFKNCVKLLTHTNSTKEILRDIKPTVYQRPCAIQTLKSEDSIHPSRIRKQKTVCHNRNLRTLAGPFNESINAKSISNCISVPSIYSPYNTHTSVSFSNLEHDVHSEKFEDHSHDQFCELCRLYKKVFP